MSNINVGNYFESCGFDFEDYGYYCYNDQVIFRLFIEAIDGDEHEKLNECYFFFESDEQGSPVPFGTNFIIPTDKLTNEGLQKIAVAFLNLATAKEATKCSQTN